MSKTIFPSRHHSANSRGFSHHLLLPILAVFLVGSIGVYLANSGSANTAAALKGPASTGEYVSLLRGDIMGRRFVGDGGAAVRTGNGYTVSFFGDSFVNKAEIIPSDYPEAAGQTPYMMHNNILITSPTKKVYSAVSSADILAHKSFIDVPEAAHLPDGKNYYWPGMAATDFSSAGKGRVIYLFLYHMYSPDSGEGTFFNFQYVGSKLAKLYVTDKGTIKTLGVYNTPKYLKDTKPITWGSGVVIHNGWAYIYGSNKPEGEWIWGFDHYVARVKLNRIGNMKYWRYWNGSAWLASQAAAKPVIPNSAGAESVIAVSKNPTDGFTFVYKKFGFLGKEVYRAKAASPQGSWEFPDTVLATPAQFNDTDYTYCAYEIPIAGGKRGVIVSHGNSESSPLEDQGIHEVL